MPALEPLIVPVVDPVIVPVLDPVIVPVREPVIVPTREPLVRDPGMVPADETVAIDKVNSVAIEILRKVFIFVLLADDYSLGSYGVKEELEFSSSSR
jgi:hypothetical protein